MKVANVRTPGSRPELAQVLVARLEVRYKLGQGSGGDESIGGVWTGNENSVAMVIRARHLEGGSGGNGSSILTIA